MAATKAQIAALYVGYFNRGADPEGLNYWLGQTQMSVVEIANSFAVQPEAKATYSYLAAPNLQSIPAIDQFITEVYQNVFERAPDQAGLEHWRNEILNGKPPGRVVVDIESGAQGEDKIILDRKTEVSAYYADKYSMSGDMPWTVENDLGNAADALEGDRAFWLSANAVNDAKAHVDQLVADSFAETLTLTPGPDDLTGTSADDVFNGAVEQTAFLPIQTLNTDDSLDGGGGRNTLNAQLVDPFVVPEKLANIQVVNINQPSGLTPVIIGLLVPVTLDVVNANAIDTINFRAPVQDITVSSVKTALNLVTIKDNTFDPLEERMFVISHTGTATDGQDDELNIELTNDTVETILDLNFLGGGAHAGYEVINIESMGTLENNFVLNASPHEIFIAGDADLKIRGEALELETLRVFNSEDLEGPAGVDARFHGEADEGEATDIDTGDGDDRLVFEANTSAILTIDTNGGDDYVDIWRHTGNVTADMGEGADYFEVDGYGVMDVDMGDGGVRDEEGVSSQTATFGYVHGDVNVEAGAGDDDFFFENITYDTDFGLGNVNADAGDGDNYLYFHRVEGTVIDGDPVGGIINAIAGSGDDEFDFDDVWQGGYGIHTFGAGDLIDGGGGNNRVDFEVESYAGGDLQLVTGGTILNIQTAAHHGEFIGNRDLLVNFALLGSVTRLELQGEYGNDVRITNLNNTDGGIDLVAIQSDISDSLILSRAFTTIPAFHLEIGNDHNPDGSINNSGVVVDNLVAGTGTDLFTITSVGTIAANDANEFSDVRLVDGNVVLQGSTNLHFGSVGEGNAYDQNGGEINASNLTGNDEIWIDDGHQTVLDGAGNDFIGTYDNGGSSDLIQLAAGTDTVRFYRFNTSGDGGDLDSTPQRELHEVTGFVAGTGGDEFQVSVSQLDLNRTDGSDINPGPGEIGATIRDVQVGDLINLAGSAVSFIKFTTASTAANVDDLFENVLGDGVIGVDFATDWVMAGAYDTEHVNADGTEGAMVLFAIDADDGFGGSITSSDDVAGMAVVGMTYEQYLGFNPSNFNFVA